MEPKVHCHAHKSQHLDPLLSHSSPVPHILFLEYPLYPNIILPSTRGSPQCSLPLTVKVLYAILISMHATYTALSNLLNLTAVVMLGEKYKL
jgi:hypothetical protein